MVNVATMNRDCRNRIAATSRNVGEDVARELTIRPASGMACAAGDHREIAGGLPNSQARSVRPMRLVSLKLQWIQIPVHRTGGNKLANLGDTALRHVDEVTRLNVPVFAEGAGIQHFLGVNQV